VAKTNHSGKRFFENNKLVYFLLVAFSFLLYGNTISHSYSLDDDLVTSTDRFRHELVEKGIGGLGAILKSNYAVNDEQNYDYRPISTYSFAIEWTLFGDSENHVHISHFINVLLYSILGIILFQLLQVLFGKGHEVFNFLITLLFLAHPIHTEVVNSLKNRDEILSLLFALLATIQTIKFIDKKQLLRLLVAAILILLSILSKKSSMPFIVIIPLIVYFFRAVSWKKIAFILLALFSSRIIISLMKINLIEKGKIRDYLFIENPLFEASLWERIPTYFYTNYLYLEKFIFPFDLNYYYGFNAIPIIGYTSVMFIISLLLFISLLAYAIGTIKKKSVFSFGILFFFISIGGAANLLYPMVGIFAERLAFFASLGLCILLTAGIYKLFKLNPNDILIGEKSKKIYLSFGAILLIMSTLTIQRNPAWKNKLTLFLEDAPSLNKSAKANSLLGQELQFQAAISFGSDPTNLENFIPRIDSAYHYYELALLTYPSYIQMYNNQATIRSQYYQDFMSARELLGEAIKIDPSFQGARENLIDNEIRYVNVLDRIEIVIPFEAQNQKELKTAAVIDPKTNNATIQSLSQLTNFETIGKIALKNGMNPAAIDYLIHYAKQLENSNKEFREIGFANTVSSELNALYSGAKKSGQNILDPIIYSVLARNPGLFPTKASLKVAKNNANRQIEIELENLYKINKRNRQYYELASQYYIKNQEFESLIKLQELQIKNFPTEYHAKQYIQIANAYYSLNNFKKSTNYFERGIKEFQKERNKLNQKETPTQIDLDRIVQLSSEINKLTNYMNELKKQRKKQE
jgi:hypothetical protein